MAVNKLAQLVFGQHSSVVERRSCKPEICGVMARVGITAHRQVEESVQLSGSEWEFRLPYHMQENVIWSAIMQARFAV